MSDFPWLSVVTFVPLAGAILLAFLPGRASNLLRLAALLVTVVTFGLSVGMLSAYDGRAAGFQLVERATWVGPPVNLQYLLGVDGISVFMVLLTTFLMPIAVLASWRVDRQVKSYLISFLILETAMVGTFVALDLLLFFLFFEALLFPMYLIIGGWGSERRSVRRREVLPVHDGRLGVPAGGHRVPVLPGRGRARAGHVRPDRAGGPAAVHDRGDAGCSWRSSWPSRSRCRCSRCTPGSPTPTPRPPRPVRWCWPPSCLKMGAYGLIRFNLTLFPEASGLLPDLRHRSWP